jgi:hypothetical protein
MIKKFIYLKINSFFFFNQYKNKILKIPLNFKKIKNMKLKKNSKY